jgi:hypothetical protein
MPLLQMKYIGRVVPYLPIQARQHPHLTDWLTQTRQGKRSELHRSVEQVDVRLSF